MTTPAPKLPGSDAPADLRQNISGVLLGFWLAVVPVKFGNPVIFDHILGVPQNFYELLLGSWPVAWSGVALALIAMAAMLVRKWNVQRTTIPGWVAAALLVWIGWTLLSATQTRPEDARLTKVCLVQFAGCVVCFGAGMLGLSGLRVWRPVWVGLALGLTVILGTALDQHFGGLESTRQWFEQQPAAIRAQLDTPDFRKKILSDRVFGTFVYPNALAGGLLLLLPITLAGVHRLGRHPASRWGLGGLLGVSSLAVLYWSGSKSGWLIGLAMAVLTLGRLRVKPALKLTVLIGLAGLGIAAFVGKHGAYFEKGASSLSARLDYWRAAGQMIAQKPILGYGAGTFQRQYAALKPPEAEMAKLAHNDYLQQGSDSGLPALLAYAGFVLGSVVLLYRRSRLSTVRFSLWLGAFAFAAQSFSEFGLYIPGLAWPFFLFLGWLWGTHPNEFDNPALDSYPAHPKS